MRIDVLTIFPEFFAGAFDFGIVRRAQAARIAEINIHNLRDWAIDKHHRVDDRPLGGGAGMVLMAEPIFRAVEDLLGTAKRKDYPEGTRVILLSPQGKKFCQRDAQDFATDAQRLLLICGRYEGIDERVNETLVTDEVSIGDYVLSGGEPAAIVFADALIRLLPNALGNEESAKDDSFSNGMFDFPTYTHPRNFRGLEVPEVLLSGDHGKIEKWRKEKAHTKTARFRKDLLTRSKDDE